MTVILQLKFYDSNSSLDVSSTCSAMNNISKSMDSLRPTPEEVDSVVNGVTSFSQSPESKVGSSMPIRIPFFHGLPDFV